MHQQNGSSGTTWAYSERIDAALRFAAAAHHGDVRKGTSVPYVMHPFHVGLILDRHGCGEDVVIAGILHDVLEDPHYEHDAVQDRLRDVCPPLQDASSDGLAFRDAVVAHMREAFGRNVLDLVTHVTEQKTDEHGKKRAWRVRKEEQLASLAAAPVEVCALKAADCLHNLHALTRDLRARGPAALGRFNAPPADILWYNAAIVAHVSERLGAASEFAQELAGAMGEFSAALGE